MHNHEHDPLEDLISKKPIFQNSFLVGLQGDVLSQCHAL